MTPCEEKGYKVGDRFRVLSSATTFSKDSIVELYRDDSTDTVLFKLINGHTPYKLADHRPGAFLSLRNVEKCSGPDWENAPEGTTHFDPEELPEDDNRWMRYDDVEVALYTWGGSSNGWMLFTSDAYDITIHLRKYILRPKSLGGIDWSEAPEGTTHVIEDGLFPNYVTADGKGYQWRKIINGKVGEWRSKDGWQPLGRIENLPYDYIPRTIPDPSIPKGVITAENLRSLALNSGLQVGFHTGGEIYVWDDPTEVGARLDNIDEYVELAEAKIEYLKVWCKHIWE